MIVGNTQINFNEVKKFIGRPEEIIAYSDSLVPIWARHIKPILMNQRYYLAIHIRDMLSVQYKLRQELVNALIAGITISGVMTSFTSITDIVEACDKESLVKMIKEELHENE